MYVLSIRLVDYNQQVTGTAYTFASVSEPGAPFYRNELLHSDDPSWLRGNVVLLDRGEVNAGGITVYEAAVRYEGAWVIAEVRQDPYADDLTKQCGTVRIPPREGIYSEDDVIDRSFQPCYVDGCPERGTVDIEIRPNVWRDFCPQHANEWQRKDHKA